MQLEADTWSALLLVFSKVASACCFDMWPIRTVMSSECDGDAGSGYMATTEALSFDGM